MINIICLLNFIECQPKVYPNSDDNILDSDQKSISINMITEENHQVV